MLVGPGDWERTLRVLKNEDVKAIQDPAAIRVGPGRRGTNEEDEERQPPATTTARNDIILIHPDRTAYEVRTEHGTGETRRELSWIWWSGGQLDLDGMSSDLVLKSEWCKSRMRVKRTTEEVLLLKEEMRRTAAYLGWRAERWESMAMSDLTVEPMLNEGRSAYAKKHAFIQKELRRTFLDIWSGPLERKRKNAAKKTPAPSVPLVLEGKAMSTPLPAEETTCIGSSKGKAPEHLTSCESVEIADDSDEDEVSGNGQEHVREDDWEDDEDDLDEYRVDEEISEIEDC
ncbi:hypothetical protein MPER_11783 [Moniliophthora perniciosa FA553]|nr:hypothetical protein MPER_11783 [Moniliophthora perniciosa FA553]